MAREPSLEDLLAEREARDAELIEERARRRAAQPLAYAELWHREQPLTSQREAAREVVEAGRIFNFTLGGNRSGKSEMGAQLDWVYALGGDHPDVVRWGERNGIDVSGVPRGPGTVWSVALTSSDSRRYVRPKVARWAPPGCVWRNREGDGEAFVTAPSGARIVFKMVDQREGAFQGDAVRRIRFDEEPHDPGVIRESKMRIVDLRGHLHFTMTPLHGWTELLREYVQVPGAHTSLRWLHGTDNPHVPEDVLRTMLATYGTHEQAARARGEVTALEGRIYVDWRRDLHVRRFELAPQWKRFVAIDWGTSVPTAILYAGYDEANDVLWVRKMVYRTEMTLHDRAEAIRALEAGGPEVERRWADPEDASTNRSLIRDFDIALVSAHKAVRYGINVVATRLRPDALGRPHLIIHPECEPLIRELDGYVWDDTDKQKPRKVDDHAIDALRYLCVGVARVYGLREVESEREAA